MKTYSPKAADVVRGWHVMDASGQTLGRLASEIAQLLKGKHKPILCASHGHRRLRNRGERREDPRDGNKLETKIYYRHSGYPSGLKEVKLGRQLETFPTRVIEHAVRGMLPHNALGRSMYRKLKVYAGPTHPTVRRSAGDMSA